MDETTIDLRDVVKTLKKRRRTVLGVFLAVVIITAVVSFIIPPTYEATATLRVKQPKSLGSSLLADLPMTGMNNTKQLMSTYAEIIKSRTVVQAVIDKTQSDKEDIPTYEDMLKRITTKPVKDTEILNVQVQAKSPEEAQYVTNALVETFMDRITYLSRAEQSVVREFIGGRLQESKAELEKAESALEEYKTQEKIVAPDEETKAIVEQLADIDKLRAENTVNLAASQANLASAEQQLAGESPGFIADNPVIEQYKTKLADLEVQLATLSAKYTDNHPQVIATRAAIDEARNKLDAEIGRVVMAQAPSMNPIHQGLLESKIKAEAEIAAASAQKQAIDRIIAEREQLLNQLPAKERGLARVQRDANVAQEIYVMLAKRYEEARIAEYMQPTDVQVIDEAVPPDKPIKPKKGLNIAIAAILGIFLGTGAAFAQEYFNRTIRTAADVKEFLDLPVLGQIPDFDKEPEQNPGLLAKIKQFFRRKHRHHHHHHHLPG